MAGKNKQEKESLCEKSMQLMMNIIKHSSFSLAATMKLRSKDDSDDKPVSLIPIKSFTPDSQTSKRKRSQAPLMSKSYLMEQDTGDHHRLVSPSSPFMVFETKDDRIDDGCFSDFIEKFHRRTKNEVNIDEKSSAYIRKSHGKNSDGYTLAAPIRLPAVVSPRPPSSLYK